MELERVDSTNRYVADAARRGEPEGLVVVADEQSAGRGRRDRRWLSGRGASLLCSVLLRPEISLEHLHLVSSLVGLAATEAVFRSCGVEAALKWPNDLVVRDRKLAGILAELLTEPATMWPAVVVGIGINRYWPENFGATAEEREVLAGATTLAIEGRDPGREPLLEAFLEALELRRDALDTEAGRLRLVEDYRNHCSTIGRQVRVVQAEREWHGAAEAIDDVGRLIVRGEDGVQVLDAADVVHLREPTQDF